MSYGCVDGCIDGYEKLNFLTQPVTRMSRDAVLSLFRHLTMVTSLIFPRLHMPCLANGTRGPQPHAGLCMQALVLYFAMV